MMHPVLAFLIGVAVASTPSVCECPPDLPPYVYCVCDNSKPAAQEVSMQVDSVPTTTISPTPAIGSVKTLLGFEAIFALAGLAAVAYLVGRKGA